MQSDDPFGSQRTVLNTSESLCRGVMQMRIVSIVASLSAIACHSPAARIEPSLSEENETSSVDECASVLAECRVRECAGKVLVEFDLTDGGQPKNLRVIASCPPGEFDQAALDAISNWEYDPAKSGQGALRTAIESREDDE